MTTPASHPTADKIPPRRHENTAPVSREGIAVGRGYRRTFVRLATGDLVLKADHHQESNAPSAWRYYEILTQIRRELQSTR